MVMQSALEEFKAFLLCCSLRWISEVHTTVIYFKFKMNERQSSEALRLESRLECIIVVEIIAFF